MKAHIKTTSNMPVGDNDDSDSRDTQPDGMTLSDNNWDGSDWGGTTYGSYAFNGWVEKDVESWMELHWKPDGDDWQAHPMPDKVTVIYGGSGRVQALSGISTAQFTGDPEPRQWGDSASQRKLMTIKTGGSNPVLTPKLNFNVKGTASGQGNSALVDGGATGKFDNRSVTLSRGCH